MTTFIKSNDTLQLYKDNSLVILEKLDPRFYSIVFDPSNKKLVLKEDEAPFKPTTMFGNLIEKAKLTLETYRAKNKCTGALFIGQKGNGKSLLMNYIAAMSELPVVTVNNNYDLNEIMDLVDMIDQEHVFMIDEIDKKYDARDRNNAMHRLLTYMNGDNRVKHLTLLAANDIHSMSEYLMNRPGRLHYRFTFKGLEKDVILSLLKARLNDPSKAEAIADEIAAFGSVSFDGVEAMITEINNHPDKTFDQIMEHLNVDALFETNYVMSYTLTKNGEHLPVIQARVTSSEDEYMLRGRHVKIKNIVEGNYDITVSYKEGEKPEIKEIKFESKNKEVKYELVNPSKVRILMGDFVLTVENIKIR